ncbi:hypothetical protein L1987_26706 [Smallanthus sonchifolius]|uniref:Uncharacterized protein n=1 Tax=Smallanthus sonchifolius TaxID=185202 RepID=A0ACB9IA29_9ASTR|nr:hypothetical protein L1987_26706 [Smallanthus sonchifolius]
MKSSLNQTWNSWLKSRVGNTKETTKSVDVETKDVDDHNVINGDETVLDGKDNVDEQMDQGLKVGESTANKPTDDDEMDDGVNLNDYFETDVTIKSISNDSDNIKVQGLKVGDKGDVNDHDVDYVLDDEVHKHDCLGTSPKIHVVPKESMTKNV